MYRDEREAAQHRIDRLRERVARRERRLTRSLRAELPRELAERLAASTAEAARDDVAPTLRVQALEQHEIVLDEVLAMAPHLEDALNALPDTIEPSLADSLRGLSFLQQEPDLWGEASSRLPKYARELDRHARIDEPKRFVVDVLLRFDGAPMAIRMQPRVHGREYQGEVGLAIATPMRSSAPPLEVRPLAFAHNFTKLFGIHHDITIGDDEIDNRFLIQGDVDLAGRVFEPAMRSDLSCIAKFDLPCIELVHSRTLTGPTCSARIHWRWDAKRAPLEAGLRILAHIRSLNTTVKMLKADVRG